MSDDLDVLPPDIQSMVRAERSHLSVPDDARIRLAGRLSAGVPGFGSPIPAAAGVAVSHGSLTAATAKLLVALTLGGGAAATYRAVRHGSPPTPRASTVAAPEVAPLTSSVVVETPEVTDREVTMPMPPIPSSKVGAPHPAAFASTAPLRLREERRLLDAARDAIVRGDPEEALDPLALHAARFSGGVLAEERDALRIRALARLGRLDEARARFVELRAAHPRSFLLEGAARDVGEIP
jgi:hypothetical protein